MHPAPSARTVGQAFPISTRSLFSRGAPAAGRAARARVAPQEAFGRFFGKKSAEEAFGAARPDAVDGAGSEGSAAAAAMDPSDGPSVLSLADRADHSWTRHLVPDPETERRAPNRSSREVKSGHFVRVRPTPLRNPRVALYSAAMAKNLGIEESDVTGSSRFAAFFSGDADAVPGMDTWATPYALSIMGKRQFQNCPFGNGNGYGDGRAVSVGEVIGTKEGDDASVVGGAVKQRWEMQLKGGGPTPFCRGADGRAVLRSSVREFLASEAMFHLGVDTTRALSLVVSEPPGDVVRRPWYDPATATKPTPKIEMDDPRLARFPDEVKRQIIAQTRNAKRDPDVMIVETCAVTTRVAPSFTRVGHVDLFARRASARGPDSDAHAQLAQMVRHAVFREFPDLLEEFVRDDASSSAAVSEPPSDAASHPETTCPPLLASAFLRASGGAIARLTAGWLRVGFCQGNFNADNCLVAGRTMDYGPFGFMDAYDPFFAKWTGSGEHFAFANQPGAGLANFAVLASSVAPLLAGGEEEAMAIVGEMEDVFELEANKTWRLKMGFEETCDARTANRADALWRGRLEPLLRETETDFVVAFRQLGEVMTVDLAAARAKASADGDDADDAIGSALFEPMRRAFYDQSAVDSTSALRRDWIAFLKEWRALAVGDEGWSTARAETIKARMDAQNPKYVLREWMLVEAYEAAKLTGDFGPAEALQRLTSRPYEEGTEEEVARYYRPAPASFRDAGTAFMS